MDHLETAILEAIKGGARTSTQIRAVLEAQGLKVSQFALSRRLAALIKHKIVVVRDPGTT